MVNRVELMATGRKVTGQLHLKPFVFMMGLSVLVGMASAQPYVDLFQVRYNHAFSTHDKGSPGTAFAHLWAGSDLPVKLKPKTYLFINPFYEQWKFYAAQGEQELPIVQGLAAQAGVITPLKNPKWSVVVMSIIRTNGEKVFAGNTLQVGAVTLLTYEKAQGKKVRFGAYMNSEFFGFFFMPLVGVDWRLDERNYFSGLLPGRFTWEHRFNHYLYGGVTFRAITSSYRLQTSEYLRIDDNQLSAFLEIYPAKRICLALEPGFGMMRKLRTGTETRTYTTTDDLGNGWFLKLSAGYRLRL